ncbi:predicted protein [Lodderomyces elongisporus NRRL YB-4239]|uniref:Uncharacterized protein n=1 Tax=Lodderomyces elongisporus (strain ATCC 11503 / CBS 2605 / JCM 1781 / NBRC 1676 / NRRL YB-4239) TaxID=379508 RepID=A5E1B6_LODEL|nr:predicted protein [Lodderomyces elongisporus NRRL YB-4239]
MTTNHRPTLEGKKGKRISIHGSIVHARALPQQQNLKYRKDIPKGTFTRAVQELKQDSKQATVESGSLRKADATLPLNNFGALVDYESDDDDDNDNDNDDNVEEVKKDKREGDNGVSGYKGLGLQEKHVNIGKANGGQETSTLGGLLKNRLPKTETGTVERNGLEKDADDKNGESQFHHSVENLSKSHMISKSSNDNQNDDHVDKKIKLDVHQDLYKAGLDEKENIREQEEEDEEEEEEEEEEETAALIAELNKLKEEKNTLSTSGKEMSSSTSIVKANFHPNQSTKTSDWRNTAFKFNKTKTRVDRNGYTTNALESRSHQDFMSQYFK